MKTLPPLLALAEGRRVRPRKACVSAPKEIVLHMQVAGMLRAYIADGWLWGHVPSGELRDKATAGKLRAMGAPTGWADLFLFSPTGRLHALELKRLGQDLSTTQRDFQTWCIGAGLPHAVVRSLDEALTVFAHWGCLRIAVAETLYNVHDVGGAA